MTTQNTKTREIAAAIRAALSPVLSADGEKADAMEAAQDKAKGATTAREATMISLADLATAGNWEYRDVEVACKVAATLGNDSLPKTVATWLSEARGAMHPNVRIRLAHMVQVRDSAWDAEDAERKALGDDADLPLRKAFARRYQTLVRMIVACRDGRHIVSEDALVNFARENDPEHDADKMAKQVQAALGVLAKVAKHFPAAGVLMARDLLSEVDADALKAAEAKPTAYAAGHEPATTEPDVEARLAEPEIEAAEPVSGAVDLDDVLAELTA